MTPPFPWFGGKRHVAAEIWARFGKPDVYVEPFAGSLAVLLANPAPARREVVADTDALIANFWRALRAAPDQVAEHADYPSIQQDMVARHKWLIDWRNESADRISEDAEFYDARVAGWWVWGVSNAPGSGWCTRSDPTKVWNERPWMKGDVAGGRGVQQTSYRPLIPGGSIQAWFQILARRLKYVTVINGDWSRIVVPNVICDVSRTPKGTNRCIFLDPPYVMTKRRDRLYKSDVDRESNMVAADSWAWAVEHGDDYRIAYCCHAEDVETPAGWSVLERSFPGIQDRTRERRERILFSPACISLEQMQLWKAEGS